ncbi:Universal stress protein A family protein C25B2,10 [Talaromyces islandicus]|uniref:Universal stress protein A family protein C25B2,10 n=1 Tax=Talaromyces islandicus TaxID=28573 RepID=A0A0U1M6W2_TALIS|nr:Universal stress protein A family protein C25B2,10 [Talaromyces islandicus]
MTAPVEATTAAAVAATSPDASTPAISLPANENESTRSGDSSVSSKSDNRRISFLGGDPLRRKSAQSSGSDSQPPESLIGNGGRQTPTLESKQGRRIPSPPPPSAYHRGVSFDTFDNRDAADFSFTLNYKHRNYQATRRGRTFLCGTDQNDYSEFALEWLIDELVDDGDEVICLRVVEKDSKIASDASVDEGRYRKEAENILKQVMEKNQTDEKAISLVLELAVGKVQEIIQRMIQIYEPAILIVGTRGRSLSGMQGLLPGSVSKYCLQQSPIPVVVVRPSTKREKKKQKRLADPTRRSYGNILQLSEQQGSGLFSSPQVKDDTNVAKQPDEEAAAVAEAVGLPRRFRHAHTGSDSKLSNAGSADEEINRTETPQPSPQEDEEEEDSTINTRVLKSPGVSNFETPPDSEESDSDGEDGGGGAALDSNGSTDISSPKPTTAITTDADDTDTETVVSNKLQLADAS